MPAQRKLSAITLDRPDPPALAAFYQRATGLEPYPECDADFAGLNDGDGLLPGFQRVDDYRAPHGPDRIVPRQFHLDVDVDDLDEAETRLLELRAGRPPYQPRPNRRRVLLDPAGHPLCPVAKG
ncbi:MULTISPECIES: VOC family protein [unclassified Streptomyces]|uniref:VOC family protein n=1 Tax=unclassified Streptomyces TaxID=2593676 RepID=UPI00093FC5C6|nr:VOC family protein [Streptomyces sp. CB01883]OKJ79243.1 glyoxalase [Streptomyces sp. CB01883]